MVLIWWIFTALAVTGASTAADEPKTDDGRRTAVDKRQAPTEGDFADRSSDGSYAFRYADRNQFHSAAANKDNVVSGRFGSRSPETGRIVQTSYSAGPRGFRARGPDIARQTDLSQIRVPYSPPVPTDSSNYDPAYDRYHDPNEDPSYKFTVRTPSQSKSETADSRGHVEGAYSYLDDVGKRHDVQYEAGAGTGFHVKTAHPDSDPFGGVFYSGPPGKPGGRPRGHTSVVLGKDGSYGFTASGPDQRRSEVSDSSGHVRGSYTYVDDKGVQRTVQYVAGPDIGYRVVNNAAAGGAALPVPSSLLPGGGVISVPPSAIPPAVLFASSTPPPPSPPSVSFEQDLFGPAAAASTSASPPSLPDRHRPESAHQPSDGFLAPDSTLPLLGSAFPEDDPALPPKRWPTAYKDKDEESFFRPFDKYDNKHKEQQHAPKKTYAAAAAAVPDPSSYGQGTGAAYGLYVQSSTAGPAVSSSSSPAAAPPDVLYGQPSRPIVVMDEKYGQYGGTDYQKPKDHHLELGAHDDHGHGGGGHGFGGFPAGTIIKAHVQNLDILPFGYRVPSPSYVFEKQFGNGDGYQNAIKK